MFSHRLFLNMTLVITATLLLFSNVSGQPSSLTPPTLAEIMEPGLSHKLRLLPTYTGCGGAYAPAVRTDFEQRVIELVNEARADHSLPPLKHATNLENAARYHATDMGLDDYLDHATYDRDGSEYKYVCGCFERIESYYSPDWLAMAENVAGGAQTPEQVMDLWMNSPGHRANILSDKSWEIGVGYYEGSGSHYRYWVQNFGRRKGVYPLVINGEASSTSDSLVSVYIYGEWAEMRLRNDDGSWSDWQPFNNNFDWTLATGAGEHTVWVELRNGSSSTSSSDTIYVGQVGPTSLLGNLPNNLNFLYSIPDGRLYPDYFTVYPSNVGSSETLTWNAAGQVDWIQVSPSSGVTPTPLTITPQNFATGVSAVHHGSVIITAHEAGEANEWIHTIEVTLKVTNGPVTQVFLPQSFK